MAESPRTMTSSTGRSVATGFSMLTALIVLAGVALRVAVNMAQGPSAGTAAPAAAGFQALLLHDPCTGEFPPQPDTCLHVQRLEKAFTFGGTPGAIHDVRLRI